MPVLVELAVPVCVLEGVLVFEELAVPVCVWLLVTVRKMRWGDRRGLQRGERRKKSQLPSSAAFTLVPARLPEAFVSSSASTVAQEARTLFMAAAFLCPPASSFSHTPSFCEENVARLLTTLAPQFPPTQQLHACILSNPARSTPIWRQRAGCGTQGFVAWDYHVIAIAVNLVSHASYALDLDSTLPFPCPWEVYLADALRPHAVPPELAQWARVVPAAVFLASFASDRRHMRDATGAWLAPPPPEPPLRGAEAHCEHNLDLWLQMPGSSREGQGDGGAASLEEEAAQLSTLGLGRVCAVEHVAHGWSQG